jgi:hypothetical protein
MKDSIDGIVDGSLVRLQKKNLKFKSMGFLMGAWFVSTRARKANSGYSVRYSAKSLKIFSQVKLKFSDTFKNNK